MWIVTEAFSRCVIHMPDQIPAILLTNFDVVKAPKLAFEADKGNPTVDKSCMHLRCLRAACQCCRERDK